MRQLSPPSSPDAVRGDSSAATQNPDTESVHESGQNFGHTRATDDYGSGTGNYSQTGLARDDEISKDKDEERISPETAVNEVESASFAHTDFDTGRPAAVTDVNDGRRTASPSSQAASQGRGGAGSGKFGGSTLNSGLTTGGASKSSGS